VSDTQPPSLEAATAGGAWDVLPADVASPRLLLTVRNAVERYEAVVCGRYATRAAAGGPLAGLIGQTDRMAQIIRTIERLAPSTIDVAICGEAGTGRRTLALTLHQLSPHADRPFLVVRCPEPEVARIAGQSAAPPEVPPLESWQMLFERARGGSIYLDEIGHLHPLGQTGLVAALERRDAADAAPDLRDLRVIFGSTRPHRDGLRGGRLVPELRAVLSEFELELPPLRDRKADIPALAARFLANAPRPPGVEDLYLDESALSALAARDWPGNLRELELAVHLAAANATGPRLTARHVHALGPTSGPTAQHRARAASQPDRAGPTREPEQLTGNEPGAHRPPARPAAQTTSTQLRPNPEPDDASSRIAGLKPIELLEREAIVRALEEFDGNVSEVIRRLGVPRTSLYRKLKRYKITTT
jgi:DNA-binding NtrC family response regulator